MYIQELVLYDFKMSQNVAEATQKKNCVKVEGSVGSCELSRWSKIFFSRSAETLTEGDYADGTALLENTPNQT